MPPDDPNQIGQDEIEALLQQARGGAQKPAPTPAAKAPAPADDMGDLLAGVAPPPPRPPEPAAEGDGDRVLAQSDVEALFSAMPATAAVPPPKPAVEPPQVSEGGLAPADVELLLAQAERALASIDQPSSTMPADVRAFSLEDFTGAPPSRDAATLDLIRDIELDLKIELGRTNMYLEDVLKLRKGAVVPLDKLAGDPVDIYVNGRLIARGEVLVLNDNFCVRVAELVAGEAAAAG